MSKGLAGLLTEVEGDDGSPVRRLENVPTVFAAKAAASPAAMAPPPLPDWAVRVAKPEPSPLLLAPSRLGPDIDGRATLSEQPPLGPLALAANHRFSRGRLTHTLLQYLPEIDPIEQEHAARAFVAARGASLPEAMQDEIVGETLAIVRDPRFAPLFAPGSLSEVPVVARFGIGPGYALSGQIDRLAILDDALLILDYKTNRPPPSDPGEVAPGYIAQLAAYRLALKALLPGKPLRAAIVWTDGPKLMEIPSTLLDPAEGRILARGASLDAGGGRT